MKFISKIQLNKIISKSANDEALDMKKSKKAGFTLIELIVVVAVLAILVGFSIGSMASVNRRKATRAGKIIDSELTLLASNAYSREGMWRLTFDYIESEDCYQIIQQYNTSNDVDGDWVDFSQKKLSSNIDLSFGGDEYDPDQEEKEIYISLSREKGCYLVEGEFEDYFCDKIFVHSANKVVTIHMSPESGGHRVED